MDFDFIAIDFETANRNLNSACSVGIVAVKGTQIVDSFYSLIRPVSLHFEEYNVKVHNITAQMVQNSKSLDELWPEIAWMFTTHCPVIAHNAHFDMSVLRRSTVADIAHFPFVDSIRIADTLVSGSKSLAHCASELGIPLENHHNALADAEVCAQIAISAIQRAGCLCIWEYLAKSPHIPIYQFADLHPQESFATNKKAAYYSRPVVHPRDILPTTDCVDCDGALYGKTIVFTGELSISREAAMQIAVNAGAVVKTSVSRKTDFLVVGKQDISLVGEDGMSSKEEKAHALNDSGKAGINIIFESQFMELTKLKQEAPSGTT